MQRIRLNDKEFEPYIDKEAIAGRVAALGEQISKDYKDLNPLFIGVLNGVFIFASDLFRVLDIDAEISFVKLNSYIGMASTGSVATSIGLNENVKNRHVIILEDIVDTGKTLSEFLPQIIERKPASLKIASFLTKPDAMRYDIKTDYVGFEISDKFVVGYGLDYDGLGRNLTDLYQIVN